MGDVRGSDVEQPALQELLQGHVCEAVRLLAQIEGHSPGLDHPDQTASQGIPPSLVDTASYLLTLPYDDLPYPAELRRLVGAHVSLGVLRWERPEAIAARLLRLTDGQFTCPSLDTFLRHNPPGRLWFHYNPNRPQDLAALYAQTRCVEAAAAVRLKSLLEANAPTQRGRGYQGIEILYGAGHQCEMCLESKRHYRWEELESLPKLPRHWGCRCMYMAWIEILGR